MPHRFAFAFVIHKVLLQASGITNETKLFVTKLQAPKTDEFLIEQKAKHRSNAVAYCGVLTIGLQKVAVLGKLSLTIAPFWRRLNLI